MISEEEWNEIDSSMRSSNSNKLIHILSIPDNNFDDIDSLEIIDDLELVVVIIDKMKNPLNKKINLDEFD